MNLLRIIQTMESFKIFRPEMLFLIAFIPMIIPWVMKKKFGNTIMIREAAAATFVAFVCVFVIWEAGSYGSMSDTQILNGKVQSKNSQIVSCSHSYSCRCRTDSKGSRSCDTCYEHSFDKNWVVHTTVGSLNITRVDRPGYIEPPRYSRVVIGESASIESSYINYIKASPNSIFHYMQTEVGQYHEKIPEYPSVIDYYRINRVIGGDELLNVTLNDGLRSLGTQKEVNIIVVKTTEKSSNYGKALEQVWLGGKKNDIVVVISLDGNKINWTYVFSWSKQSIVNVQIRDAINNLGTYDSLKVGQIILENTQKSFVRKSMKEFEYLLNEFSPPTWVLVLTLIFGSLLSFGFSYWCHVNQFRNKEKFNSEKKS